MKPEQNTSQEKDIVVYSNPNCQPCRLVKRKLDTAGVDYEERNLADYPDKAQEFKNQGYMQAPVVVTPDFSFAGYEPSKLQTVISNANTKKFQDKSTSPAMTEQQKIDKFSPKTDKSVSKSPKIRF